MILQSFPNCVMYSSYIQNVYAIFHKNTTFKNEHVGIKQCDQEQSKDRWGAIDYAEVYFRCYGHKLHKRVIQTNVLSVWHRSRDAFSRLDTARESHIDLNRERFHMCITFRTCKSKTDGNYTSPTPHSTLIILHYLLSNTIQLNYNHGNDW